MRIVVLGIDLGKNLCSLAGLDETGAVILRRRMKRASVLPFTAQLETCTVAMEACCGAHHLGRQLVAQGHVVRLMSPAYVKPYVKAQKNDERDAEAIAEAATRPTMRYVEIKSEAQLEVQSLHRVRGRLVAERTALINQLRALMLERGIAVPQGRCKLARYLPAILADERNGLVLEMPVVDGWEATRRLKSNAANPRHSSHRSLRTCARRRTRKGARRGVQRVRQQADRTRRLVATMRRVLAHRK